MPNKLYQFWLELKRRRVVHVIVVYATAAFVILEAVDIIFPRLNFPDWTVTFVMILLAVGFPIALIFSWIFDVTQEGIEKTIASKEVIKEENITTPNSWRIATYVSVVVVLVLLAFNLFGRRDKVKIDDSLAKSIAVLPFHNLSGDDEQDFICDGLTGEIISNLFKVRSFDEVRSLTSVLPYRESLKSTTDIAIDLRVNYVLEGSFKRIEDDIRVTAELIDPISDNPIWLKDYDLHYEEVTGIPAEIALQIANHLNAFITESETQNILKLPTSNQDAYEFFLQISYILNTHGITAHSQALDLALEAIRLDPNFADPYAWAGIITLWKGVYIGDTDIQNAAMEALPFFEKALELDQNNASAHNGMGLVNEWARWDYIRAEKEYLKSIELEPNNSFLYGGPVEFFLEMHRDEDLFLLIEESPEEQNFDFAKIQSHILSGHKKEANKLIIQMAGDDMEHRWVGEFYLWLEEYNSAKYYLESAMQSGHPEMSTPRFQAYLALVYEKTSSQQQSRTKVNQLIAKSDTTSAGSPAYFLGWYYSWMGDLDSAFFWLDKAYENHSPEMAWLKVDPAFNNLKDDDRYWDLYERTGHKAYDDYMANENK